MSKVGGYYGLSSLLDDDVVIVALLLQTLQQRPLMKTINDLEMLRLNKYVNEIDKALDLKVDTIRDLKRAFFEQSQSFKNERAKVESLNLLDFIGKED